MAAHEATLEPVARDLTRRLKYLLGLAVLLLVVHTLEEYLTDFYDWSPIFTNGFAIITAKPILTFLVLLWVVFGVLALMAVGPRTRLYVALLPGLLFTFELHHWVEFFVWPHYRGGDGTALLIPVFLFFYWTEWWRNLKEHP